MKSSFFDNAREKRLFRGAKKLDKDAFIRAYDLYVSDIFRFIYFKVGDHDEAQDLTSQVFLKTWNYLQNKRLEDSNTLRALLYKVSRTTVIDYYRKGGHDIISIENDEMVLNIADEKQMLSEDLDLRMEVEEIMQKLKKLKSEYRDVIIMKYINELEITEIAEITGKSKGNVRILTHRALNALRELTDD